MNMRTRWLVEPKDKHTNKVLSLLRPGDETSEVEVHLPGNITKPIEVWQVSFKDLTFLERSKGNELNYRVFAQEGDGQIRPHTHLLKKRTEQKRRAALKAMAQELKKIPKQ